jgi:hypothetical protein
MAAEAVLLTFTGVNMAGKQESGTRKLRPGGKEHPIAEAPGVVEITKWVGSHSHFFKPAASLSSAVFPAATA